MTKRLSTFEQHSNDLLLLKRILTVNDVLLAHSLHAKIVIFRLL
jgi:hypothetical protein